MRIWNPEKIAILTREYPTAVLSELAERLGVTVGTLQVKASQTKVRGEKAVWNNERTALLRDRYPKGDLEALAADLGVTRTALARKAWKLRLYRARDTIGTNSRKYATKE